MARTPHQVQYGIIPAYAGSTPETVTAMPAPPRIIPAYAGSTPGLVGCERFRGDHPRIRGEHQRAPVCARHQVGSSPHTRGARRAAARRHARLRIIPAYAGSTRALNPGGVFSADHPRIRGEHSGLPLAEWRRAGSSPHTRGAPKTTLDAVPQARIIPAYAGSTPETPRGACSSADHPRIRGEHTYMPEAGFPVTGSSPHTRGAPPSRALAACWRGIIPAYAGSTWAGWGRWRICGDHPRIRGEHVHACRAFFLSAGSSPHTRGAPAGQDRQRFRHGIIPAYAGSTPSV